MQWLTATPARGRGWFPLCIVARRLVRGGSRAPLTKGRTVLASVVDRFITRAIRGGAPALLASTSLLVAPLPARAQGSLPPVTVGAGVQTSFVTDIPDGGDTTASFPLNSVRLYVNGSATDQIKFMFDTEYDGAGNHLTVLDAAARFEYSDRVNFWVGRMLPPSDRSNLNGPYYSHHWAVYTDGVQDGYPFVATGRDNGVLYWGQFGKAKISAGAFDGASATGNTSVLGAGRVQLDFWDQEAGYYLNGTYYGDKNILAVAGAGQVQDGNTAYNGDFLLERKVGGGGAFSVEAEFARYDHLGGYSAQYGVDQGGYVLGSYLFPPVAGMTGRFELLGKFAQANFSEGLTAADVDYDQKTTELNFNYLIKQFNARIMIFYLQKDFSAVHENDKQVGVGFQVQM
jgi:hypothetical protein